MPTRPFRNAVLCSTMLLIGWQPARAQETLVIVGATLIDGTGAPARPATIVIRDGTVATVADPGGMVPDDARTIDATGKYVIPGLADMHVHFGTGGLVGRDANTDSRILRQFLYYGVTSILNVGATGGSIADIQALRAQVADHRLLAPHIYATGGLITVPGSHPIATIMEVPEGANPATYDWTPRGVWVVSTPAEIRDVVRKVAAAHMDGIKIVVDSGPTVFGDSHAQMSADLVAAATDEGARSGLSVFAHASSLDELEIVVAGGVRAVMHLVTDPAAPGPDLLAAMHRHGTYYVPTLSLFIWTGTWGEPADQLTDPFLRAGVETRVIESLLQSGMAPTASPSAEDRAWRASLLAALKTAHDAGITIVGGSDTANPFVFPGFSMHDELALMVEAGLTPMEALMAATRNAAQMLGKGDEFGTITAGRRADLLILTGDPIRDIRNTRTLETVIANGTVIDRATVLSFQ